MNRLWIRMSTGWDWVRAVYLAGGAMVCVQALLTKDWSVLLFGAYFSAMGLFGFGCAAGRCSRY